VLTDGQGSVREIVGSGGSVEDQLSYGVYGNLVSESNPSSGDRFKYAGGQYDSNLGIYNFEARWYNPADGGWISEDPLGLGPDSNPYRYVGNGPTNGTDPAGLWPGWLEDLTSDAGNFLLGAARETSAAVEAAVPAVAVASALRNGDASHAMNVNPSVGYLASTVNAVRQADSVPQAGGNLIAANGPAAPLYGAVMAGNRAEAAQQAGRLTIMGITLYVGARTVDFVPQGRTTPRADFHVQMRSQGYQYHHTTQGGYVLYRHPNGSQVWIRPNGQVIRTGPCFASAETGTCLRGS
jgi:RHS repeat-associated protein